MVLSFGNYANGRVPLSAMTPVANFVPIQSAANTSIGSNLMMPEAARQLSIWQTAYKNKFGIDLNCSECYRPLVRQNILWQLYQADGSPVAAVPGTSNHGYGRAIDFGSPVSSFGTEQHNWMASTAESYGFQFDVASEAWHASYYGNPTITTAESSTPVVIKKTVTSKDFPMFALVTNLTGGTFILIGQSGKRLDLSKYKPNGYTQSQQVKLLQKLAASTPAKPVALSDGDLSVITYLLGKVA